jgi:hypothetical protein
MSSTTLIVALLHTVGMYAVHPLSGMLAEMSVLQLWS